MAEQVTLYLDTAGVYHTDEEKAQEAQDILNNVGGKNEAIEDLSSLLLAANGESKYWSRLTQLSNNPTQSKGNKTNGVEMFRDIFNRDFSTIYELALSIAEHRYTLPVAIEWQTISDRLNNHINDATFQYSLSSAGLQKPEYGIGLKGIGDGSDYIRLAPLSFESGLSTYDVRKHATEDYFEVRAVEAVEEGGELSDKVFATFTFEEERDQPFSSFNLGMQTYFLSASERGGGLERIVSADIAWAGE